MVIDLKDICNLQACLTFAFSPLFKNKSTFSIPKGDVTMILVIFFNAPNLLLFCLATTFSSSSKAAAIWRRKGLECAIRFFLQTNINHSLINRKLASIRKKNFEKLHIFITFQPEVSTTAFTVIYKLFQLAGRIKVLLSVFTYAWLKLCNHDGYSSPAPHTTHSHIHTHINTSHNLSSFRILNAKSIKKHVQWLRISMFYFLFLKKTNKKHMYTQFFFL